MKNVYDFEAVADPFKTIYVDPDQIIYSMSYPDVYTNYGTVKPGPWDTTVGDFEKKTKFQSLRRRFVDGVEWEETEIFDHLQTLIEMDGAVDGCRSVNELKSRYEHIDELYHEINSNGYKTGDELSSKRGDFADICVAIGRDGSLIQHGDGIHRLSIAKILDLSKIPVKVSVRHFEWQRIRERIAKDECTDPTYRLHPDVKDLQ
ncbi:hypothetical protein [Natronoglomus mannanivorans]|uniref:ParB-like nuclease domain-containing protein n=1 Tax=Natronoglomus mannanivorans TaxID=2979990 RepID=A0AAP3E0E3_9EURY|nr:hypothetical protein [Halobacteria archaeon AArc-xg1-1]